MQLRTVISGHRLFKTTCGYLTNAYTKKWIFLLEFWHEKLKFPTFNKENNFCYNRHNLTCKLHGTQVFFFFFESKSLLTWLTNCIFCNNIAKVTPQAPPPSGLFLIVRGVILMNSRVLNCQKIMTSAYRIISSIFSVIPYFFLQNLFFVYEMKCDNFKIVCTL